MTRANRQRRNNRLHQHERRARRKAELLASVPQGFAVQSGAHGTWYFWYEEYPEEGSSDAYRTLRACVRGVRETMEAGQ